MTTWPDLKNTVSAGVVTSALHLSQCPHVFAATKRPHVFIAKKAAHVFSAIKIPHTFKAVTC